MRLLVSENDPVLGAFLQRSFDAERYVVDLAQNEEAAKAMAHEREYDLAILDISWPGPGGLEVLRTVRAKCQQLPIIVFASPSQLDGSVRVLDMGVDDFVLRPFFISELTARVRALLRRSCPSSETVLRVDDLQLDRVKRTVTRAGRVIELTPKEFSLLEYLARNAGQCVTRAQIIKHVWNLTSVPATNVVDVYINYVRKKVDGHAEHKLIYTIRGAGYQLQAERPPGQQGNGGKKPVR